MKNTEMKNTAYMISWDNILLILFYFCFVFLFLFCFYCYCCFCFAYSFIWNKEVLGLTKQIKTDGGLPTSLMVNAPPNHSSLKNYSLQ